MQKIHKSSTIAPIILPILIIDTPTQYRSGCVVRGYTPEAFNQVWHLPTDDNTLLGNEWVALFNKEMNTSKKVIVLPMYMLKTPGLFTPQMREMPEQWLIK